jgi:Chaperone of endosialidase
MNPLIQLKTASSPLVVLALLGFALLPAAQAVVPPPDGGYPGFTTAEGTKALFSLTTGSANTAVGWFSLFSNAAGSFNTATGAGALLFNTADENTAFGAAALLFNTTGTQNTAVGAAAVLSNTMGSDNTAVGANALSANTTGSENTALGHSSLGANIDGDRNTAVGEVALSSNFHGNENTANGYQALAQNTDGAFNVAVGTGALSHNTIGESNTAVGAAAGQDQDIGSGNVYIGAGMVGIAGENNHTYIGNVNLTTVSGGNADTVTVDLTTGLLGHASSSRRYKEEIQPMDDASEALYRLKPVTYHFKKEIDPMQSPDYGLVAEDVAQVDPNLAIRDGNGQIENVRYTAINAMLLNEFLKEHKKTEKLEATVASLITTVKEQAAQIQKVSAQLEASKPALQVVNNP